MSIAVPGYGDVPVIWRPAKLGEDASYGRGGKTILAIVHHRMVGTLPGTIRTFQSTANRPVSTQFGIGFISGKLTIAQFVDLRDTAFGNGNYDPSGRWDDWGYPTTAINARTVSIEHEDGATTGRGIVKEPVIAASIELDRLLLSGNLSKIRAAGIRATGTGGAKAVSDLGKIKPGPRTIIMHHDIAGRLKPYCWTRWLDDPGFPAKRYIAALAGPQLPDTSSVGDDVKSYTVPKAPTNVVVKDLTWLYVDSAMQPSTSNVQITNSPNGRELPLHGTLPGPIHCVEYVDSKGVHSGKAYFVRAADVTGVKLVTLPTSPEQIASATLAGRRAEWDRQSTSAKVALAPKP